MCIVDLDVLLPGCASSTWGDKKQLCIIEAKNYVEVGLSADSNPYIAGTWTYQWFLVLLILGYREHSCNGDRPVADRDQRRRVAVTNNNDIAGDDRSMLARFGVCRQPLSAFGCIYPQNLWITLSVNRVSPQ